MSIIGILVIIIYKGKIIGLIICYSLWTFLSVLISVFISIIADQKYSSAFLISIFKAAPIFFRFLLANDLFVIVILLVTIVYNIPVFLIVKKVKNVKRWKNVA
jgi:glycerol-3-phosphate acyltransferase PlsY